MARKSRVRLNGEGAVYKEELPGRPARYVAQIYIDGKKVRRIGATSSKALEKLQKLRLMREEAKNPPAEQPIVSQLTVAEWRKICQTTHLGHLRPNIRQGYDSIGCNHIDDTDVGRAELDKVTREACENLLNHAANSGLAYHTVRNIRSVLHKILEIAKEKGRITTNPADKLQIPLPATPDDVRSAEYVWTHEQLRAFFEAIEGHRLEALFYLAPVIGPREAEILAIVWDNIDFQEGTVFISRQLRRLPVDGEKSWVRQYIKNHARRTLMVGAHAIALLRERQATQEEERQLPGFASRDPFLSDGGLVFTSEEGGPIHASSLLDIFERLVKRAGVPPIRFHDLRHTCASLMLANGEPVTNVSAILGHRSPAITTTIYAHAIRGHTDEAIARHVDRLTRKK